MKRYKTDFLLPKSSVITGMGSIMNIVGNYFEFNYSDNPDKKAIENDWGVVGNDIFWAVNQMNDQLKNNAKKKYSKKASRKNN